MRVCVYGASAIGGHAAARLADAGTSDVSIVARGAHLRAVEARGLRFHSGGREIVSRFAAATDDPSTLPPQDLVIVTLKAPALPDQAEPIARLLAPDGAVIFFTNGIPWWWNHGGTEVPLPLLDPDGRLWHALGPERVLGGVVLSTNEIVEPGVVLHRAHNRWRVGEPNGSMSPRLDSVLTLLSTTKLGVEHAPDIRRAVWEKLVLNVAMSSTAALTRLQTWQVVAEPSLRRLVSQLVEETLAVGAALGWDLRDTVDVEKTVRGFEGAGVTPSMLQDVLLGRPMEVEAIAGQVYEFGREAVVPTPALEVLVPLLRGVSRSRA